MPPRAKRALAWSNGELLDLISVWGEEAVQSQLRSSHRNYDTFGKVSKDMMERGHDRDTLQCRIKVKELWSAYRKAHDANGHSGAPRATCQFYKELDAILGVNPTSTPSTTMDTSEPVGGGGGGGGKREWWWWAGWRHPGIPGAMQPGALLEPGRSCINLETSAVPLIACSETAKTQEETVKKRRRHAARSDATIY
ncbi:zinc finger and SCAN domain-containing protein 29-like [Malaclemys terrapin pileata]|uniref:zinc finger and SCAN domain-containing protein 29-like n=1 Tax=Malaclemys terrapin pileata TaxID=2991368 RepID=UPI0023A9084A|nr:zinc finger and SCAN domain-containing protein 29-like [Malaclemys terrapin pileata]